MTFGSVTNTVLNTSTGDNNIDSLISERRWMNRNVTFSFTDNFRNDYESGYANSSVHAASFSTLNAAQRAVTRAWAGMFNSVSGLNLTELTLADDRNATIRLAESRDPDTAYAYTPWNGGQNAVEDGDIWFNPDDYNSPSLGNYAHYTIGHELGHALGLEHGHESNGIRDVAMNRDRDSMEFSIMTYRSYIGAPVDFVYNETHGYAQSLMMYDIRAIQQMYGANFSHNAGATTYSFSSTTGEMSINGVGQGQPGGNRIFRTIWDGNGIDTYDFSNYTTHLNVDLAPGGWSDLDVGGNAQRARLNQSGSEYARGHIFNALQYNGDSRSLIENARGGAGNDQIKGNRANNMLTGNGGDDTLRGNDGSDSLWGNDGSDRLYGDNGDDRLYGGNDHDRLYGGNDQDWLYGGNDGDWLYGNNGNDRLYGEQGDDYLYGQSGDDYLYGGDGRDYLIGDIGRDRLYGGADDDWLSGGSDNDYLDGGLGADTFYGGTGSDLYVVDNVGDSVYETSGADIDKVEASVSYTLTDNVEVLLLTGSAAIDGTGNTLDNQVTGNAANNQLDGQAGNDEIDGQDGRDRLLGGDGNDVLKGGAGTDELLGGNGNDTLIGYGGTSSEYDTLTGGLGFDTFVLGDSTGSFYEGSGYASITDFTILNYTNPTWGFTIPVPQDKIQIFGAFGDYRLSYGSNFGGASTLDTAIYKGGDLIGVVQDTTEIALSSSYFTAVSYLI